jgi:tetratricopeptide (TPR) repeat protein
MLTQERHLPEIRNHFEAKQYQEALLLLEKAVAIFPSFYVYHELIGDVCVNSSDHQYAYLSYSQALKINPRATWIARKIKNLPGTVMTKFCGIYDRYPDITGKRKAEGGKRVKGIIKNSLPNQPLVTIITVCLNSEKYLEQCIRSVMQQTYKNLEYIIIDGGSNDGTLNIIEKYADEIDYYLSERDRGLYHAMNKGLALASGDYILILNSDDWYETECVKALVEAKLNIGTSFVSASARYVDKDGVPGRVLRSSHFDSRLLFGMMTLRHETMLLSTEIYNDIGPYNESFRIISDRILTISLLEKNHTNYEVPRVM